ncbi:unnamed protein product [Camellia sinensis]
MKCFGLSDPHPNRNLESSAMDMLPLSYAVGVTDKFWVVGYSGESMHAWAVLSDTFLTEGAVMVAPMVNPFEPSMTKKERYRSWGNWTPRRKLMYFLARRFPSFLAYFYRRSFLSGNHGQIDKWLSLSLGNRDRALIEEPMFKEFWQRDVEESVRQRNVKPFVEEAGRPEMVVGWYHSHPGFGCWLSGVDINTQQALIHGLNRHYYSIAINYRKNELEEKMLLNLHKKKWTDGLTLQRFDTHSKTNEQTVQKMQKQMSVMVTVLVTKEGKRLETALGRSMEKAVKANTDALWAHFQEENAKQEKLVRERTQQITSLITNCINKDLPAMVEKTVKKELAAVGPAVARAISPAIEKTISTAITEAFQRGVGDKAVNQLEKSVNSKLEATVARQIQAQFQTSGKQALQDALKSSLEASVIPAFEMSCKAMFEQVDATFQKGMIEHATVAQQQFETRFEFGGLCFMTRWMDFSF